MFPSGNTATLSGLGQSHKATIVMMAIPITSGHTIPMLKIASHLVQQGHEVFFIAGSDYKDQVARAGAIYREHPPWITDEFRQTRDSISNFLERSFYEVENMHIASIPQRHRALRDALQDALILHPERPVVIMHEHMSLFASLPFRYGAPLPKGYDKAPPVINIPVNQLFVTSVDTAVFGPGLPPPRSWVTRLLYAAIRAWTRRMSIVQRAYAKLNEAMRETGATLPVTEWITDVMTTEADVALMVCSPSMEYPRRDLSRKIRFIGCLPNTVSSTTYRGSDNHPSWWIELQANAKLDPNDPARKKIVMVAQGTGQFDYNDLLVPTMCAMRTRTDVIVVALLCKRGAELEKHIDVPQNARIVDYLPYEDILALADVSVQNGGYGGWSQAVIHGVPTVLCGAAHDKKECVMRANWLGVSVGIKKTRPTVDELRDAISRSLDDSRLKARAVELMVENKALDAMGQIERYIDGLTAS